jgi:hypothetical protein
MICTSSSSSFSLMAPIGMFFITSLSGASPTSSIFSNAPLVSSNFKSYVSSTKPVAWLNTRYAMDFDE